MKTLDYSSLYDRCLPFYSLSSSILGSLTFATFKPNLSVGSHYIEGLRWLSATLASCVIVQARARSIISESSSARQNFSWKCKLSLRRLRTELCAQLAYVCARHKSYKIIQGRI